MILIKTVSKEKERKEFGFGSNGVVMLINSAFILKLDKTLEKRYREGVSKVETRTEYKNKHKMQGR